MSLYREGDYYERSFERAELEHAIRSLIVDGRMLPWWRVVNIHVNDLDGEPVEMGPFPAAVVMLDAPFWWWLLGKERRVRALEARLRAATGVWVQVNAL